MNTNLTHKHRRGKRSKQSSDVHAQGAALQRTEARRSFVARSQATVHSSITDVPSTDEQRFLSLKEMRARNCVSYTEKGSQVPVNANEHAFVQSLQSNPFNAIFAAIDTGCCKSYLQYCAVVDAATCGQRKNTRCSS